MKRKPMPKITEPDESRDLVHYGSPSGSDQVTLCGKTDWIGENEGQPTRRRVTCRSCLYFVRHFQMYRPDEN